MNFFQLRMRLRDGFILILLWLLIGICYLPVEYWWLEDDPLFLQGIARYGVLAHFYRPEVWQDLMPYHLMPWVILSFGIDWQLFDLNPIGYYWHHVFSFVGVITLAFILLRQLFSRWICATVLIIFILSQPTGYALQLLMVRHYIEGLGFSLLATFYYLKALSTQKFRWTCLGSLCYLIATTAKEIYVPLVIVLPFLPFGEWRQRYKMLFPFVIIALGYVFWRLHMLGLSHLIASYDTITVPPLTIELVAKLPKILCNTLGWNTSGQIGLSIFTLFLFVLMGLQVQNKYIFISIIVWISAVILPIIPVLSILSPLNSRYLFLPFFLFCISLAFLLKFLSIHYHKFISLSVGGIWIISALINWGFENQGLPAELLHRNQLEGKFVLTETNTPKILFAPYSSSWHYDALLWLKVKVLQQSNTVTVCYDPCVCTSDLHQFYRYETMTVQQIPPPTCQSGTTALDIQFSWQHNTLYWHLNAAKEGQFWGSLNAHPKVMGQFFPIPAHGQFTTGTSDMLYMSIKHTYLQGYDSYSPQLQLDTARQRTVYWKTEP